jgi:TonB-linked SusC/RagA family outer membrane protein
MRKIFLMVGLLLFTTLAIAQTRTVTGRVLDNQGNPIPFATISEAGTTRGTSADANGNFTITISEGGRLNISSAGYTSQTVAATADMAGIRLAPLENALTEVVVTGAFNTKRTARSTSYNAQVVGGEQLNVIRQTNLNNALAGKVSGLQVRSQSAAALGRSNAIRLRGESGLGGGEGVIYVVDGTILPNADDINLDDVQDVTVLQGPAASALLGPQGANGAIVITLKKGTGRSGVEVNLGAQFDRVSMLPNYQNAYAGGASSDLMRYTWQPNHPQEWKALDGKYYHDYSDDASWGPRMLGQEYIPWYSWYGGHSRSYTTASLTPQPDNARDFFNTGVTLNNSLAFTKSTEGMNLRFSYGNIDVKGLLPTSSLKKNTFNLNTSFDLNKKFTIGANLNYITQIVKGDIDDEYSNQSTGSFNQWFHRNLDMGIMRELKDLRTPGGIYASWNKANPTSYDPANERGFYAGNYWYNFYTWFDLVSSVSQRDRLFGDVSLTYKITPDLRIRGTYRKQQMNGWFEEKFRSELNESGLQTTGNAPQARGYYGTGTGYQNRRNVDLLATYSKKIREFQLNLNAGADFFRFVAKSNSANTNNGLNVPNLFTTANSKDQASVSNGRAEEKYRAVFARGDVGFRNFAFIDFTVRNDWFSTLPQANNDVLSKSVGASFVFSDLLKVPAITFGKIRASWGEIPKALGTNNLSFGAYRYPGAAYGVGQFQWNGNFLMSTPDQVVDSAIRGAVVTQKEIGVEMRFLNNRFGFNATYWDGTEKDFPFAVTTNGASGFTSKLINTGEITKRGIEVLLNVKPVWAEQFKWEINATYGRLLENKVVSIAPDVNRYSVESIWRTAPTIVHQEGKDWGQLYGSGIKRIDGQPVVTAAGAYVSDPNTFFGSALPKYTGGVQNSIQFLKGFTLNVNIDYQSGGKFFSLSDMWGSFSGLTARTATINDKGNPIRDRVVDGGGIRVRGIDADKKPVDVYVEAQDYYHNLYNNNTFDEFIYDLTFVKLREVSLGYNIPVDKIGLNFINRASFTLVARNPVLIYAKTADFDPSEISKIGGEAGQLPGTRGFGFNLRVGF